MRGIVLAGGIGSRLAPMTDNLNKHCLQVGDRPMVSWPLKVLRDNDIHDIMIVSSKDGVAQLSKILGAGYKYAVQQKPAGIADALMQARGGSDSIAVILGDNIFLPSPKLIAAPAHCYLHSDPKHDLRQFGVVYFSGGIITKVIEKPNPAPLRGYAMTGLYTFDVSVFEMLESLPIGKRGEYEISDLLNLYAEKEQLSYSILEGFWGDAGTYEGMTNCREAIKCAS